MITETVELKLRRVEHIRELQTIEAGKYVRRIGMLYFQWMPDGGFIPRVVTNETDGEWIINLVNKKLIYVPVERITAEKG
jgi:hypothetical protein